MNESFECVNPFVFSVNSCVRAMKEWTGSNFLFLVGGRRTCGQAHNMAKGPALLSCGLVKSCLVHTGHKHGATLDYKVGIDISFNRKGSP